MDVDKTGKELGMDRQQQEMEKNQRILDNLKRIRHKLVVMSELTINPGSGLAGKTVDQLNEHTELSVIALRRPDQQTQVFPHFKQVVSVGDTLTIQTLYDTLRHWHEVNKDTDY